MKSIDNLSIREVLCLAIAIEDLNAKHYEEWALRFRTYDPALSALFDDMRQEECVHGNQLRDLYLSCFGKHIIPMDPYEFTDALELVQMNSEHFFVVNHAMAERILEAALKSEEHARLFYASLVDSTQDELLNITYRHLANAETDHVAAIERRLDRLRGKVHP